MTLDSLARILGDQSPLILGLLATSAMFITIEAMLWCWSLARSFARYRRLAKREAFIRRALTRLQYYSVRPPEYGSLRASEKREYPR